MNHNPVDLLLVEDSSHDAELTIRELKNHNLANNLFHVKDGEEAIDFMFGTGIYAGEKHAENPPKLILMDINMPKVNGMEVLEMLKSDDRTAKIPIVILTSSKEDLDIQTCYKLGANSYIVKPVNFKAFTEAIKNLGFYWLLLNQPPLKSI